MEGRCHDQDDTSSSYCGGATLYVVRVRFLGYVSSLCVACVTSADWRFRIPGRGRWSLSFSWWMNAMHCAALLLIHFIFTGMTKKAWRFSFCTSAVLLSSLFNSRLLVPSCGCSVTLHVIYTWVWFSYCQRLADRVWAPTDREDQSENWRSHRAGDGYCRRAAGSTQLCVCKNKIKWQYIYFLIFDKILVDESYFEKHFLMHIFASYLLLVFTISGCKLWCRWSIWTTFWLWKGRTCFTHTTLLSSQHMHYCWASGVLNIAVTSTERRAGRVQRARHRKPHRNMAFLCELDLDFFLMSPKYIIVHCYRCEILRHQTFIFASSKLITPLLIPFSLFIFW